MNKISNSSLVTEVLWARETDSTAKKPKCRMTLCASVPPTMRIVLVGQGNKLGDWQPTQGIELVCEKLPTWGVPAKLKIEENTPYKFVIMEGENVIAWEEGDNRVWIDKNNDLGKFRGLPNFFVRMAGTVIPVSSIRSKGCEGIGDYVAMGEMAQWAASTNLRVIQTLPINDTTLTHTPGDSYPYNAISIFALNPLYIRISAISKKVDVSELIELNHNSTVDFQKVDLLKWTLLREAYTLNGKRTLGSKEFKSFFEENKHWLGSYAAFSLLRDKYSTADYSAWEAPYNQYSPEAEKALLLQYSDEAEFYYFLQFHADKQLRKAHAKARSLGVAFKGDIPIGVSRHSVEVWKEPHLFNLNAQAGAPPDAFSTNGQNWGFPTYNWHAMSADGYAWWKRRFKKMADYFDMYRIDHILGFFRIWEIPVPQRSGLMGHFSPSLPLSKEELSSWGLPMYEERYMGKDEADKNTLFVRDRVYTDMYHPRIAAQFTQRYANVLDDYEKEKYNAIYTNYFYHRHNDFWAGGALCKLPELINATSMLCCAEDLGMIPDCVSWVLKELQVATLEIQRMPKDPHQIFASTADYPYGCVAATSTHDMSTLREWWEEDRGRAQQFYNEVMGWWGNAPANATTEVCEWIIKAHLDSAAMAVILPWQDLMSIDEQLRLHDAAGERINVPSNPKHVWNYRMHLSVEELRKSRKLNNALKTLIEKSGR